MNDLFEKKKAMRRIVLMVVIGMGVYSCYNVMHPSQIHLANAYSSANFMGVLSLLGTAFKFYLTSRINDPYVDH